jgi:CxxC-x17-CxxC domain-containing protein
MEYRDRALKCVDCGAEFVFTSGEQLFFADRGFRNEPKRCKPCKSKRGQEPSRQTHHPRVETATTCTQCGKETTVPFKPSQGRPIYCRECFQQRRNSTATP